MRRFARVVVVAFALLVVAGFVAVLVGQRVSDGPIGPIAGGPLRAGELVADPDVEWSLPESEPIELALVEPPGSRLTGAFVYDGQLYVPCDLGFIWRRVPRAGFRTMLSLIWRLKHWHEHALADGRVVLRIDGKRYQRQAVRVTDPELLATLRAKIEQAADAFFSPPGLLDLPADPDAIWFFRIDPRPAQTSRAAR